MPRSAPAAARIRSRSSEATLARRKSNTPAKGGAAPKGRLPTLKLVRIEPGRRKGIVLVFESGGEEREWLLEQTTVTEFLALLLRGRIRNGRRIQFDAAELTIEPPVEKADDPLLCIAMGPLELCASVDHATAKAMKTDLDRAMKRLH